MKMSSVQPRADTPTDTMTDLKKFERVCNNLSADNCLFLVPSGAYSLSFCRLIGGATVKFFIREPYADADHRCRIFFQQLLGTDEACYLVCTSQFLHSFFLEADKA